MQSYLRMMAVRLLEMRRVLAPTGSIYLHCDATASHYLKLLMDAVFGRANFRNEIHWYYYNKMHDRRKKLFAVATDTVLFYAKDTSANFQFTAATPPANSCATAKPTATVLFPLPPFWLSTATDSMIARSLPSWRASYHAIGRYTTVLQGAHNAFCRSETVPGDLDTVG